MNDVFEYFRKNQERCIQKWTHYFDIYDRHFSRFRGKNVNILEIGVQHGGSLQMWKHYFGKQANIYGVDIDPSCNAFEEEQIKIIIGDQENCSFLKSIRESIPRVDILIDDGGHTMKQQINTFEELFHHISDRGVYLCEDLHTSYLSEWGGGFRKHETFIEYSKKLIDHLYGWYSRDKSQFDVSEYTKSIYSMTYYDSILVIEKRPIEKPYQMVTGNPNLK